MWHDLIGENSRKRSENYSPESTESIDLQADFASFTQKCLTESFITESQTPSLPPSKVSREGFPARRFLTIRAWWKLWRVTRSLSQQGFSKVYNAALHQPKFEEIRNGREARLSAALKAFARAENFFHLKKAPQDCLPRSLALFRFLHSIGLAVEHRIGLQQFPFLAHAWTEYHGEVLHDDPRNQERFTVIAKIPA
jgi:hypothetical protein